MKITLVDLHESIVDAAIKLGWSDINTLPRTDIKTVPYKSNCAFVSPANSIGFMDGGIDYVLSRTMFPGIEDKVKAAFRSKGHVNILGRPYLPIGNAITVETQYTNVYLISAPTMYLPQDVRETHNAYHAMYAILHEAKKNKIEHLYLCGLCTGYGKMTPEVAIKQMHDAYLDFLNNIPSKYTMEQIIDEQPKVYMNTEFKEIHLSEIKDLI